MVEAWCETLVEPQSIAMDGGRLKAPCACFVREARWHHVQVRWQRVQEWLSVSVSACCRRALQGDLSCALRSWSGHFLGKVCDCPRVQSMAFTLRTAVDTQFLAGSYPCDILIGCKEIHMLDSLVNTEGRIPFKLRETLPAVICARCDVQCDQ
jgi:hypothetical protein